MLDHSALSSRILALCEGENDTISLMATVSCEIHHSDDRFHWTGFYRVVAEDLLKIGPYQGGHGCLVIPFSRGVCGAAARLKTIQMIDDVNAFEGHIACSSTTQSELVLPVQNAKGALIGVFDIDSDLPAAFTKADADAFEAVLVTVFAQAEPA